MVQMMNDLKSGNGDEVDSVLSRFFRAELPHPWPECVASAQAREAPMPCRASSPWRETGRFALAASIVLFVLGYVTLAGFFPKPQSTPTQNSGPHMGNNPLKTTK